jgi:uncharacterized phiE125 gp8 family phage protein
MAYKVTIDPTTEPVTLTEAKNWLKISTSADDDLITMLIESERQILEDRLNIKLISQTIEQKSDRFPATGSPIYLEANPVSSVTSVYYKDAAGSTAEFANTFWDLDNTSERGRIYLNDNQNYPTILNEEDAIIITYVSGYANAAAVPDKYKKLLLHMVSFSYENRQNPIQEKRTYLDKLIKHQRITWFE